MTDAVISLGRIVFVNNSKSTLKDHSSDLTCLSPLTKHSVYFMIMPAIHTYESLVEVI